MLSLSFHLGHCVWRGLVSVSPAIVAAAAYIKLFILIYLLRSRFGKFLSFLQPGAFVIRSMYIT